MRLIYSTLALALVSGCAYDVKPIAAPAFDVVTSSSTKISGRWMLHIEASKLNSSIRPKSTPCSGHSFPVTATDSFAASIRRSLENAFDNIEYTSDATVGWLSKGYRGIIVVRAETLNGYFQIIPGFWANKADADIDASASLQIDGRTGRLFGQTFDGRGRDESDPGGFCEGVPKAIAGALEKAMRDISRKIVEAASNSDRVRNAK